MKANRKFYQNQNKAVVITAYQLSNEELVKIKSMVPLLKNLEVENVVDKTIIGGIIIQHRSSVIDLSLKSRLEKLRQSIYENI